MAAKALITFGWDSIRCDLGVGVSKLKKRKGFPEPNSEPGQNILRELTLFNDVVYAIISGCQKKSLLIQVS